MPFFRHLLYLLSFICTTQSKPQDDMTIVFERLHEFIYTNGDCTQMSACVPPPESSCQPAIEYSAKLWPNGTWPDIDYTNQEASDWTTVQHLVRTLQMARAYLTPSCPLVNSTKVLGQTHLALDVWLTRDFKNPNWWWNQFGVPQYIGSITVLLLPLHVLTPQEMVVIDNILARSEGSFTGQNLVWSLQIQSMKGLFENNVTAVATSFAGIWSASSFANGGDGVQADGSFYQHGQLLQSGAYGADFALTLVVSVSFARGTMFAMPLNTSNFECLNTFWLDGEQYAMRNNYWDVSVKGREITRAPDGALGVSAQPLIPAIASLGADPTVPRYAEWAALARRLQDQAPAFVGTRHFWWNDYTTHHRPGFFVSLRSTSTRTYGAECVNGEGQESWHMGEGATMIYQEGNEYKGIFPVWDWTRIPGTTAAAGALGKPCDVKKLGRTSFVGGASDGMVGVSTLDFVSNEWDTTPIVSARKTWVWLNEGFVALIANVSSGEEMKGTAQIVTTLDQCRLQGAVITQGASGAPSILSPGSHSLSDLRWLHHNNVVYAFLTPSSTVSVRNENVSGSWKTINSGGSASVVTMPTLTVSLEHTASTSTIYAVLPGVAAANAGAAVANLTAHTKVVSNTPQVQALLYTTQGEESLSTLFASVFAPEDVSAGKGWQLSKLNAPCLIVVGDLGKSLFRISAANPLNKPLTLSFEIDRVLTSTDCSAASNASVVVCEPNPDGASRVTIFLAQGQQAGSSSVGCCAAK